MREIRQSGLEGGGAEIKIGSPYPYVRPRARSVREVKVLSRGNKLQPEADRNCVAARRGGEQRKANDQSVGDELDTARRPRRACLPMAKPELKRDSLRRRRNRASTVKGRRVFGDGMVGSLNA